MEHTTTATRRKGTVKFFDFDQLEVSDGLSHQKRRHIARRTNKLPVRLSLSKGFGTTKVRVA
jgi:GTP cyclohydrolase III